MIRTTTSVERSSSKGRRFEFGRDAENVLHEELLTFYRVFGGFIRSTAKRSRRNSARRFRFENFSLRIRDVETNDFESERIDYVSTKIRKTAKFDRVVFVFLIRVRRIRGFDSVRNGIETPLSSIRDDVRTIRRFVRIRGARRERRFRKRDVFRRIRRIRSENESLSSKSFRKTNAMRNSVRKFLRNRNGRRDSKIGRRNRFSTKRDFVRRRVLTNRRTVRERKRGRIDANRLNFGSTKFSTETADGFGVAGTIDESVFLSARDVRFEIDSRGRRTFAYSRTIRIRSFAFETTRAIRGVRGVRFERRRDARFDVLSRSSIRGTVRFVREFRRRRKNRDDIR